MAEVAAKDIADYGAYLKSQGHSQADVDAYTSYLSDHHGVTSQDSYLSKHSENPQSPDDRGFARRAFDFVTGAPTLEGSKQALVDSLPAQGSAVGQSIGAPLSVPGEMLGGGLGQVVGGISKDAINDYQEGGLWQVLRPPTLAGVGDAFKQDAQNFVGGMNQAMGGKIIGNVSQSVGDSFRKLAETKAFKAAGAMLKDFRTASAKGDVEDVGRFMLDNGIVRAGDSIENIAEKAGSVKQNAGQALNQIYVDAQNSIHNLTPDKVIHLNSTGFNPVRDKGEILDAAAEKLGDSVDGHAAITKLSSYLDQIGQKYGDTILDPRVANNIKGAMDDAINYSRNPLTKQPDVERAFSSARKYVSSAINEHIQALGEASGNPGAIDALKKANQDYSYASQASKMATDKLNREMSNRMFGLTDTIAAEGGGTTGALIGSSLGHPALGAFVGSAVNGIGNKIGRSYGGSTVARGADILSQLMGEISETPAVQGAGGEIMSPLFSLPGKGANALSKAADSDQGPKRSIVSTTIKTRRQLDK